MAGDKRADLSVSPAGETTMTMALQQLYNEQRQSAWMDNIGST